MSMNVLQLADKLRTEADAYKLLEEMRWGDRPICPHCGSVGEHYFLNPLAFIARATREELAIPVHRDAMIQEAREADASWDEINAALEVPR
jgi:hypothetical protein